MNNGNKLPFVSFCITTYKRPAILKDTLLTIARQTFTDFEVIISDNSPDTAAGDVVKNMNDNRFKYFWNGENLGMISSFNKSIERASSEYVVMITDDDPVYPDMLETLIQLTADHPGYGMYLGGANWFCTDPDLANFYGCKVGANSCLAFRPINEVNEYDGSEFLKHFFNLNIFPNYLWSCAIVRRSILIEMGGVPDYGTPFLGDYAYMGIMGGHSGCVTINKALGHQTLHKQNFGREQNDQLLTLPGNFLEYVGTRLSHVKDWDIIEQQMKHFVAVWVVRHLAFLIRYSVHNGDKANHADLKRCEREIFALPLMKPYKRKYYLLVHFPRLHDKIVSWRKKKNR